MSRKKPSVVNDEQAHDGSALEQRSYTTPNGWGVPIKFDPVANKREDVLWATQQEMAHLLGINVRTVNQHLKRLFRAGELSEESTIRKFGIVALNGRLYNALHYNLKAIIAVGFRVNSEWAQEFRQWANEVLEEYIVEGFALDEARLKQDPVALQQLSARIEELRNTEIDGYKTIRSFCKLAAKDYDPSSKETRRFYATLQDLFTYAITGKSSAEILLDRADHSRPNMGLMCIKGKHPASVEIEVAKNYFNEKELTSLQQLNEDCKVFLTILKALLVNGAVPRTLHAIGLKLEEFFTLCAYPIFPGYDNEVLMRNQARGYVFKEFALYTNRVKGSALPKPKTSKPSSAFLYRQSSSKNLGQDSEQ